MSETYRGVHWDRPGADALEPADSQTATQIADNLWMSTGLSNSYMFTTSAGRVIVNTGMGFEGPIHKHVYDEVDASPIHTVVITQGHYDHVGGIKQFLEADGSTEVIAGGDWRTWRNDNERLARFRTDRSAFAFMPKVLRGLKQVGERFPDADISQGEITPTIEVTERRSFTIGDLTFETIPVRGGETTDSLVIWLPEQRICLSGNTFGPLFAHVPNLVTLRGDRYRDPLDVLATIETVRALGAEVLVTGHFEPIRGAVVIERELSNLHGALQHVHDATVAGMNAGKDVHTLMRTIEVPAEYDVGEGYGQTKWNVRAIWENYAGWFHHDSSTELYGVSPRSVHPDLVELAGAEAIVAAARKRLDAGEPLEAIHLAEIAGDNLAALEVLVAAHEILLAESVNFWERSWLQRRLEVLGKQIGSHQ